MMQMAPQQNEIVYPSQIAMPPQTGGNPLSFEYTIPQQPFPRISQGGDGVLQNPMPGGGPVVVVDTSGGAMAQMGLGQISGRRPRRYQSGPSMGGDMDTFSPPMPTLPSGGAIRITKLE